MKMTGKKTTYFKFLLCVTQKRAWFCSLEFFSLQYIRSFLSLLNSCVSFYYLSTYTHHINRCFQFLAIANNDAICIQFPKVQVYLWDKFKQLFSWDKFSKVCRIAETDVNIFVILVNITSWLPSVLPWRIYESLFLHSFGTEGVF